MHASSEAEPSIPSRIHSPLISAIEHKQRVTLTLTTGVDLAAEPHVYGIRGGRPSLLVYLDDPRPTWQAYIWVRPSRQELNARISPSVGQPTLSTPDGVRAIPAFEALSI